MPDNQLSMLSSNNKKKINFNYTLEDNLELNLITKEEKLPPCDDGVATYSYFNRRDVKLALNVKEDIEWNMCSSDVGAHYNVDKDKGSFFYILN